MTTTTPSTDGGATVADPAAAAAAANAAQGAPPADGSQPPAGGLLTPPAADPPPAGEHDWLPEKFRVVTEGGELDHAASARKLAESYRALESHKGPMLKAPDSPDGYVIEPPKDAEGNPVEGIDVEAFTKDPLYQELAKRAHAAGIPNEHMQFFVGEYLQLAPQLFSASKVLTIEEASAELSALWGDKAAFDDNLGKAVKLVGAFTEGVADDAPGSNARVVEKFGTDPDFIAFAARIAGEVKLGEDGSTPKGAALTGAADIEALQKSEPYWNPQHPEHARVKAKVEAYYAQKFGTAPRR